MAALINLLHFRFQVEKNVLREAKIKGSYDRKCIQGIFQELNKKLKISPNCEVFSPWSFIEHVTSLSSLVKSKAIDQMMQLLLFLTISLCSFPRTTYNPHTEYPGVHPADTRWWCDALHFLLQTDSFFWE